MKDSRLRILYCESNIDGTVGGSFYSLLFLVESLDRSRYDPIVVFYRDNALIPRFRRANVEVRVFRRPQPVRFEWLSSPVTCRHPALRKALAGLQSALNFLRFFVVLGIKYARFLRRERIDLVHLNNSITRNNDWMLAALLTRTRCLTHERGINHVYPTLSRFFVRRLNAVICISEAVRSNMLQRGIPPNNLTVIHNGLDPSEMVRTRRDADLLADYDLQERRPIIGMASNIKAWKGQHLVIQALSVIRAAFPNVACLFMGDTAEADEGYARRLRALVAELGLEDAVRFTGYQRNVADFLALLDVSILASSEEPFGRVLLEAMAMRKPIVANRSGAVPEIVVEGVTGYTFPDGDWQELAARTIQVLRAPDAGRTMGENGYRRLTEVFHVRRNVEKTLGVYRAVFTARPGVVRS